MRREQPVVLQQKTTEEVETETAAMLTARADLITKLELSRTPEDEE